VLRGRAETQALSGRLNRWKNKFLRARYWSVSARRGAGEGSSGGGGARWPGADFMSQGFRTGGRWRRWRRSREAAGHKRTEAEPVKASLASEIPYLPADPGLVGVRYPIMSSASAPTMSTRTCGGSDSATASCRRRVTCGTTGPRARVGVIASSAASSESSTTYARTGTEQPTSPVPVGPARHDQDSAAIRLSDMLFATEVGDVGGSKRLRDSTLRCQPIGAL